MKLFDWIFDEAHSGRSVVFSVALLCMALFGFAYAARADGPPPCVENVVHVGQCDVASLPEVSRWDFELRGGLGTEPLVGATLMRDAGPISVGISIDYVGQSATPQGRTTTQRDCWHKLHCGPGSSNTTEWTADDSGLALYQAELQYRLPPLLELDPYLGFSLGGLDSGFAGAGVAGFRMRMRGGLEAGLAYRWVGSPDLPSALHAAVVTLRLY